MGGGDSEHGDCRDKDVDVRWRFRSIRSEGIYSRSVFDLEHKLRFSTQLEGIVKCVWDMVLGAELW